MLVRHVALVSETRSTHTRDLTRVAAAIQKQVIRDFAPLWGVAATVNAFTSLDDVPPDYLPVIIEDDINVRGAAGVHLDRHGQVFALVQVSPSWPLTASHEILEMLADPTTNRLVAGQSPKRDQGRVLFLVEACDPCEAAEFAYTVNGITVSDFITPHYEDPMAVTGVRYSFRGNVTAPHTVLKGGYVSWIDPVDHHVWQLQFFGPHEEFHDLSVEFGEVSGSLRSWIDRHTLVPELTEGLPADHQVVRQSTELQAQDDRSSAARAVDLREQIQALR
jgi:hypothetical protein